MTAITQGHFAIFDGEVELSLWRGEDVEIVRFASLGEMLTTLAWAVAKPVRPPPPEPPAGTPGVAIAVAA